MLKLLIIALKILAIAKAAEQNAYNPWTSVCQEAVFCLTTKANLPASTTKDPDLKKADEVVDKYLTGVQLVVDIDKINEVLKTEGIDEYEPEIMQYQNMTRLGLELDKVGMNLVNGTMDEQADGNVDMSIPITYKETEECMELLNTCTVELEQLATSQLPLSLQICPWQTYAYNWFHCQMELPPKIQTALKPSQTNCSLLPECERFDEWELFVKDINLPEDWKKRKAFAKQEQIEFGGKHVKILRQNGRSVGIRGYTNDDLLAEIAENPDKIIQQSFPTFPPDSYTKWITCKPNYYASSFRPLQTVHGVAGIGMYCSKTKSRKTHSAGKLVTLRTKTITNPRLTCDQDYLLTGLNIGYLQRSTWTHHIETLQGLCTQSYDYGIPTLNDTNLRYSQLKCPEGQAICALRISLQAPILRDYERMYDIQLYCCDIQMVCTTTVKVGETEIFQYDNYYKNYTQIDFKEPIGFKKYGVGQTYTQEAVTAGLSEIYEELWRPPSWIEPDVEPDFGPLVEIDHVLDTPDHYVYAVTKQWMICDHYVYYFKTNYTVIRRLSATECKPRIVYEYGKDFEFYGSLVKNVQVGVDLSYTRSTSDLEFQDIASGLRDTFMSHGYQIPKKYFVPLTNDTDVNLDQVSHFTPQLIGICATGTEYLRVYTDQLFRYHQPHDFCSRGADFFVEVGEYANDDEPNGQIIYYELQIGISWRYKARNVRFPRGTNNGAAEQFNIGLGSKSQYTGFMGWEEQRRRNYFSGIYKKTYKVKVPFMRKIKVYQLYGHCQNWLYLTGFKLYHVTDLDDKCLAGVADAPNEFTCMTKIEGFSKVPDFQKP